MSVYLIQVKEGDCIVLYKFDLPYEKLRAQMESATFRKWLADRGCRFDEHKHRRHPKGHAIVTVHHDGHVAELPLVGSNQHLDPDVVRQICEKLNFDWSELPGPKGRA